MTLPNQIPGGATPEGSPVLPVGTPLGGGVVPTTPAQPVSADDWKARYDATLAELENIRSSSERDLRGVKSSLQSQIAGLERQRDEERQRLEAQVHQLATKGLDENEQTKYNFKLAQDHLTQKDQQLAQMQSQLQTLQEVPRYISSFLALGISPNKLVVDQGVDALLESGWRELVTTFEATKAELAQYKSGSGTIVPAVPGGGVGGIAPMTAPLVASPAGGTAMLGNAWPQVIKAVSDQFGYPVTQEEIYRMVELGQLSSDIIPGMRPQA